MFAWQDEVPIFEYVSIEDNAVVVQVLDAGFWESILNVPAYAVQDVEAAHADFDDMKFLKSLLIPTNLPHSNKQPIALTCDAVCYSFLDCLL